MTTETPALVRDLEALLNHATRQRPDINRNDLQGAILGAEAAGRSWGWILVQVAQMLARGETPYDLRTACAPRPWERPRRDYDRA